MTVEAESIRAARPLAIALFCVLALAFTGCGAEKKVKDAQGCELAEQPSAKQVEFTKPTESLDPEKSYTANFQTNCGTFSVALDVKNNPVTASSFAGLVEQGLYDGTWFHRIVAGFVVQGGDPAADGTGNAGYDVFEKPTGKYELGTVAMAKSASDPVGTSSSQFYIVIGEQGTQLPPDYAIAGKISSGDEVVKTIAGYANPDDDGSGTPTGVALIQKATLTTKG